MIRWMSTRGRPSFLGSAVGWFISSSPPLRSSSAQQTPPSIRWQFKYKYRHKYKNKYRYKCNKCNFPDSLPLLQQSRREDERAGGRGGEIHQRQDPKGAKQVIEYTNTYVNTNTFMNINAYANTIGEDKSGKIWLQHWNYQMYHWSPESTCPPPSHQRVSFETLDPWDPLLFWSEIPFFMAPLLRI